jgi:RNA polymerase sigma-70 factor (ECF subfamily)
MPLDPSTDWVLDALARFERPLLRYAAAIAGSAQAPDVVQDTFLRLCAQERAQVEGRLAAWLFTVCRNRALELRRSGARLEPILEEDSMQSENDGPSEALERKESMRRVMEALSALPERQREAVLLKFSGGLSYREMADVLETSASNVGFLLHTALRAIRERVAEPISTEAPARAGRRAR